ncbi:MAG: apolipoprotein N-acyltransferase [Candidatus Omnitrophica bacterium]|nr:apolipoprotein N-acyltransferase [Candidatus Omnitrophota bacterium]
MLRKLINSTVKDLFLCFLSAALLALSFSSFNLWVLAWFGFLPLFFALSGKSKLQAFFLSYTTGFFFWLFAIYWLIHVTPAGLIVLSLYLGLYFAIFGFVFSLSYILPTNYYLLFIPSLWVGLEYIRGYLLSGFPWSLLGYSQYRNLAIIQIADITGVWGVSFLVMLVNVVIKEVIIYRPNTSRPRPIKSLLLVCALMFILLCYGIYKLYLQPLTSSVKPIRVSVIQGNIPQELKWDASAREFVLNKYFKLTDKATRESLDLIIWPEAAVPVVLEEGSSYYGRVMDYVKNIKKPLLFGAVTYKDSLYYNSALLVSGEGRLVKEYAKFHLVPFGEYIPLRKVFPFLETIAPIGDIAAGEEYTLFNIPGKDNKFAVLICFEDVFPELSRSFVNKGADFLINITNDAWFGATSEAYQHLAASVFRAVENRVYLLRSANTGISGFVLPTGRVISLVEDNSSRNMFITGYKTQDIFITRHTPSFYAKYGDLFAYVCILYILYVIISRFYKKK